MSTFARILESQPNDIGGPSNVDGDMVDEDDVDESDRFRHQCRPHLVIKLAKHLAGRKDRGKIRECFKKTGFNDILKIADWGKGLPKDFVKWATDNFESDEMQIRMNERQALKLQQTDAHRVYNIPVGGRKVAVGKGDLMAIAALRSELELVKGSTKKFENEVVMFSALEKEKDGEKWSKLAILYILGVLLCPGSHGYISLAYAEILLEFDHIKNYNWSGLILDHIKEGIPHKGTKSPKADFHFMLVNYIDRMASESPMERGNFRVPTCQIENVDFQKARLRNIKDLMSFKNGITYGWTYTGFANAPLTFDPHCCPIEKVPTYANWVKAQLSFLTETLRTLDMRMGVEQGGSGRANVHTEKKKKAKKGGEHRRKRVSNRASIEKGEGIAQVDMDIDNVQALIPEDNVVDTSVGAGSEKGGTDKPLCNEPALQQSEDAPAATRCELEPQNMKPTSPQVDMDIDNVQAPIPQRHYQRRRRGKKTLECEVEMLDNATNEGKMVMLTEKEGDASQYDVDKDADTPITALEKTIETEKQFLLENWEAFNKTGDLYTDLSSTTCVQNLSGKFSEVEDLKVYADFKPIDEQAQRVIEEYIASDGTVPMPLAMECINIECVGGDDKQMAQERTPLKYVSKRQKKKSKYLMSPYDDHVHDEKQIEEDNKKILTLCWSPYLHYDDELYRYGGNNKFTLRREEFWSLQESERVSTFVIDAWANILNIKQVEPNVKELIMTASSALPISMLVRRKADNRSEYEAFTDFVKKMEEFPYMDWRKMDITKLRTIIFPVWVKDHYVAYVLSLTHETISFLTSMPGYTLQKKGRRTTKFHEIGTWLMHEAQSYISIMYKERKMTCPYSWEYFEWESPKVPEQPDGTSCGVFVMKFCEEWQGVSNEMKSFAGWETKLPLERENATNLLRMQVCLEIVKDFTNMQRPEILKEAPLKFVEIENFLKKKAIEAEIAKQKKTVEKKTK